MLRAVGYARISKDDTLEGRGVARQTEDIKALCQREGWQLLEVLTDNDISASRYSRKKRPGYSDLLSRIESGAVDRAVVYDVDRLLRQPRDLEDLIDLCEKRNGAFGLHNVNGELDLVTSSGRFVARMLVAKAAMESDDLSRRHKRANDQKAAEGKPHGARAFGYEADGITINATEAALLRQAAADVLAGTTLNAIARRWNDLGATTPQRNRPWSGTVVKAVLTNPRQAGLRVHRGEVVGPGVWEPIIDRETHERLVAHLNRKRPRTPSRRTPFTSLIRDAATRIPLDRDVVRGRPTYRGHKRPGREATNVSIAAVPLEELILEAVFTVVEDESLSEAASTVLASVEEPPAIAAIEEDLRLLAEDFGNGIITRGEWLAARQPLERRMEEARASIEADQRQRSRPRVDVSLRDRWPELDVDAQREILASLIEAVLIHPAKKKGGPGIEPDRVDIEWRA